MRARDLFLPAILFCAVLGGSACGPPGSDPEPVPVAAAPEPVVDVETARVRRGSILQRITAPGSLMALRESRIGPEVRGRIAKIFVSELSQRIADAGCEILGLNGQLHPEEPRALAGGRMQWLYRLSPMLAFGGGTYEVQRDIIGFMGHGLPRR